MNRHVSTANGQTTNHTTKDGGNNKMQQNGKTESMKQSGKPKPSMAPVKICSPFKECLFRTLVPFFLMFFSPIVLYILWYTAARCQGSFIIFYERLTADGLYNGMFKIWLEIRITSCLAMAVIGAYVVWSLFLMVIVPGPRSQGPVTPNGNIPIYKDNGFSCYVITMVAFSILAWSLKTFTQYSVTIVYDHFDEFLGTLTIFSHILCTFLHLKGLVWPSSTDCGTSGNIIFDYYWGTELYPRVFGIDIKVFTNCRFGMTVWPLLVCIYSLKNYELYGFVDGPWVSCVLQMVYFTKFFWWEAGYMNTIDIMLDRAGVYICYGCLAYVPGLYASVSMYLATQSVGLGTYWSVTVLLLGLLCCAVNYLADMQKLEVRRTNGNCLVWGRRPDIIRAEYTLENGETKTSLLLASGYWGIARHFHYIPELGLAFLWSVPALFQYIMPYTYFIWLIMLLTHRTFRDDTKCSQKYQKYWEEYCSRVPYKIIPYVF